MFGLFEPRFGASARSFGVAADPVKRMKCANQSIYESFHSELLFHIENMVIYSSCIHYSPVDWSGGFCGQSCPC